jgi:hypothetical protein
MNFLKRLFKRKKQSEPKPQRAINQVDPDDYWGLSNREKVKKACQEYDAISTPFTSKMIYSYLGGLVSPENTYKQIYALHKLGFLSKITVLCSDPERNKHKHFYELNKDR